MKIINLHGKIAEKFGAKWILDVESIVEALRAIDANTGNFFKYLSENRAENKTFSFILDDCNEKIESEEELLALLPRKCKEFHIIPNAEGALQAFIVPLLISVATSFIVSSLFRPPTPEEQKQTKSFLFQGAENVASQGVPVPLGYGRLLVGSIVVSSTMRHVDRDLVDRVHTDEPGNVGHVPWHRWGDNMSQFYSAVDNDSFGYEDPEGVFDLERGGGG